MELQAISRVVRIGQTKQVFVLAPYLTNTLDDIHKEKHSDKSIQAQIITGDSAVDSMYDENASLSELLSISMPQM